MVVAIHVFHAEREEEDGEQTRRRRVMPRTPQGGGILTWLVRPVRGKHLFHPCLIDLDAHMVHFPRIRSRTCPPRRTGHHETQASGDACVASLPREPASAENIGAVLSAWEI